MENPEGWGGYSLLQKTENPGRRGVLSEIPSVVGVWIFSGTTHSQTPKIAATLDFLSSDNVLIQFSPGNL